MSDRDIREIADEFVLGLLEPEEAARVEAAMAADPALRAAVAESRERFLELDLAAPAEPVSAGLWGRIEMALDEGAAKRPAPRRPARNAALSPANDDRFWRRGARAGLAASILLAVALGWSLLRAPAPEVIAVLLDDQGAPVALIEDFGGARARLVVLADLTVPQGRALQVWTKPSEETGPVSIGLLGPAPRTTTLGGAALPPPREAQLYEITMEQAGGSPTGLPTGPIIGKGFATAPR